MKYLLGIDIGSVNAKIALLGEDGKVLHLDSERIVSNPRIAVNTLFGRLTTKFDSEQIVSIGVSGSGKSAVEERSGWTLYSSSLAILSGLLMGHPDARTVIQIGGQSSVVIELEDGLKKPWKIASNSLCAAGTGRFLEQQAYRLGISIDDFAAIALKCKDTPPRIAARCSVFAKSDLIHLQQKGVSVEAMLFALSESIARMVAALKKGVFAEPVYFIGGVAGNGAIVKALEDVISTRNGHDVKITVPENYFYMEAIGAGWLSRDKNAKFARLPDADMKQRYYEMPKLDTVNLPGNSTKLQITEKTVGYLGVDVGSTSTKAVILDEKGKLLAKTYLMTAGRPVDAVRQVMQGLLTAGADKVKIEGVGVTGSGRYLIGSLIGADMVKNEITAQTRAAVEVDPNADIIEIGGQDSKLVIKRNGVVVDYQMNKACAAGTGSFIDELAEMLGVSVKDGEFANLAFDAPHTIDLGTRCAAFMAQAVASAQQEGVPLPVITASLANSIAKNYLSKVVGTRKLGERIILTGAVFYNQAVVAAFKEQLKGKAITVAEHREVSGAIGAALLARERPEKGPSKFRGFAEIADLECQLTTFICNGCDNNCTITRMQMPGEKPTFYGSRCDKYDATVSHAKQETQFDAREKLLLADYKEDAGKTAVRSGPLAPTVGIPRALMIYDFAPLFIGFLNALGVKVVLSSQTNKEIIERSTELAYADSCFPVKLLHGHAAALLSADYILYPSAIRLSLKEGEENQRYACPLVQASPYIIREIMGLKGKLITPIIDFSLGNDEVIQNLTQAAAEMGFNRKEGRAAALAGLEAQQKFERARREEGARRLAELRASGKLGVVIIARAYMFQDAGANLGIADKLAELGVVPVPLDFLPIDGVSPSKYSDRPYWSYEGKFLAAAEIVAKDPHLYGLFLSNFGCGPNSFMIRLVEDIMGGKPLGQLEIDEHAAEAGLVTRLEAFVDTIREYDRAGKPHEVNQKDIYRGSLVSVNLGKTLLIPNMAPHAHAIAAAMRAFGAKARVMPEPDERNLLYANQVTAGTECLPFRVTLGDFMRFHKENGHPDLKEGAVEGFMSGSYGPCRLGKYAIEQIRILKDYGVDMPIRTSVSNNAYRDMGLGPGFERHTWRGMVSVDYLQRLLWRSRPYEKRERSGSADKLFKSYLDRLVERIERKEKYGDLLKQATKEFKALIDPTLPRRPLIGINGEIFLRANDFANNNLVKTCEAAGLEVVISPMSEWLNYISYRNLEDKLKNKEWGHAVMSYIRILVQQNDEEAVHKCYEDLIGEKYPTTEELISYSREHLSPRCGSEAVLSIGAGIEWLKNPEFAGVISVMPHGCMPGGIVAAMAEKFTSVYQKPWISLTYDGFAETNNLTRINEFAELVRFCQKNKAESSGATEKQVVETK